MKKFLIIAVLLGGMLSSCKNDKDLSTELSEYFSKHEEKGFHFGDALDLPASITEGYKKIELVNGNQRSTNLKITPQFFHLGDNDFNIEFTKENGEVITQEADITVYSKITPKKLSYSIVKEYPHDPKNFVQGFQLDGNTVYESDGQEGSSKITKYPLGQTASNEKTMQPAEVFSEGCTLVGDKIYQLTWRNKKGFIYDKNSLKLIKEFAYPSEIGEGWGLTFDGTHLLMSDGSNMIYFLDPNNPSKVVRSIGVANNSRAYDQLNELEYKDGKLYANVWRENIILQIDPKNGDVLGELDLTAIGQKHTKTADDVLNGIAFKGDKMLVTGKYWPTIYELEIK